LVLAAILLSMLIMGLGFFGVAHQRTLRALEAARQQEMVAREAAEAARRHAERALEDAKAKRE
jgi:Tfp pilus assembly protein PilV